MRMKLTQWVRICASFILMLPIPGFPFSTLHVANVRVADWQSQLRYLNVPVFTRPTFWHWVPPYITFHQVTLVLFITKPTLLITSILKKDVDTVAFVLKHINKTKGGYSVRVERGYACACTVCVYCVRVLCACVGVSNLFSYIVSRNQGYATKL